MRFLIWFIAFLPAFSIINYAQSSGDSVIVLPVGIAAPAYAKKMGTIKVGNNATATDCDYISLILDAKRKAREMGGNIVKITSLIAPAFISKCYKIEADVYYAATLPDYKMVQNGSGAHPDTMTGDYALLCIYRLPDTLALEGTYNLHLDNDSVICKVKSKLRDSVKIYKEGRITLWAKTEQRSELKLDVKKGKCYYVRCGLIKGEIRMVPVLELVDNTPGANEFGKGARKKKNVSVNYLNQVH